MFVRSLPLKFPNTFTARTTPNYGPCADCTHNLAGVQEFQGISSVHMPYSADWSYAGVWLLEKTFIFSGVIELLGAREI